MTLILMWGYIFLNCTNKGNKKFSHNVSPAPIINSPVSNSFDEIRSFSAEVIKDKASLIFLWSNDPSWVKVTPLAWRIKSLVLSCFSNDKIVWETADWEIKRFLAANEKESVEAASLNILYCSSLMFILSLLIANIKYINFTYI